MAETSPLLRDHTVCSCIAGSNPALSAISRSSAKTSLSSFTQFLEQSVVVGVTHWSLPCRLLNCTGFYKPQQIFEQGFHCNQLFLDLWRCFFKGVVAVPVKTACDKATSQNKRPRKPRARFRDLRFFKVKLAAPQIHFLKISWQCNSSPGDQILMKLHQSN